MPLSKLTSKILEDAEAEAKKIIKDAEKEAENISEDFEKRFDYIKKQIDKRANEMAEIKRRNVLTSAKINAKNEDLIARQDILNKVFGGLEKALLELSEDEYKKFISNMIKKTGIYNAVIIPGKKDRDIFKDIERDLKNENINIKLENKTADFDKGFIIKAGELEINLSLSAIINSMRERLIVGVKDILFKV